MAWDEDGFRDRIQRRAAERGLTIREVMRKAGLPEDTFKSDRRELPRGRTFNTIEKIAEAVGLSVAEALGYAPVDSSVGRERLYRLLPQALRLVDHLRDHPYRDSILIDVLDCLIDLDQQGPVSALEVKGIEAMVKRLALNWERAKWAGNELSPFRGQSEPQSSAEPRSETADQPSDDQPDEGPPAKTAA